MGNTVHYYTRRITLWDIAGKGRSEREEILWITYSQSCIISQNDICILLIVNTQNPNPRIISARLTSCCSECGSLDTVAVRKPLNRRVHPVIHAIPYCLLWRGRISIEDFSRCEFNALFLGLWSVLPGYLSRCINVCPKRNQIPPDINIAPYSSCRGLQKKCFPYK